MLSFLPAEIICCSEFFFLNNFFAKQSRGEKLAESYCEGFPGGVGMK